MTSAPRPPRTTSFPPLAVMVSLPPYPQMTSFPAVPTRRLGLLVPLIVHGAVGSKVDPPSATTGSAASTRTSTKHVRPVTRKRGRITRSKEHTRGQALPPKGVFGMRAAFRYSFHGAQ